ncbi:MAG: hypothetical protein ACOYOZ_14065, partial [Pirellula sp.]
YSALAVLVLEDTASSTIKAKKRNFNGQRRGSSYFALMSDSASRQSITAQKVFFHGCLDSSTTKSGAMHEP